MKKENAMPAFLEKLGAITVETVGEVEHLISLNWTGALICPREVYNEIPAIRQSDFKRWIEDPKYFAMEKKYPKDPTEALIHGTLFDVMLFDPPEEFERRYAFGPDVSRSSKEWKDWAKTKSLDIELFKQGDYERFSAFKESFTAHAQWAPLIAGEYAFQVVCLAKLDGIYIKAALDMLTPTCIVDAKLLEDASAESFGKKYMAGFGYDIQAAWYRYCCPIQGIPMYFACQEKHRFPEMVPNSCQWLQPSDEDVATAMRLISRDLPKFAEALRTGIYEGYPDTIAVVKIPVYAERLA